jgi:23S rRNA (guanine2445-N2)-methyltransferase / 23S rRNA (guanine2069-N7)-methyltransferase
VKFSAIPPPGLEAELAAEMKDLGAEKVRLQGSSVSFQGDIDIGYRACLWSRLANRILLPLTDVAATSPEVLYKHAKSIRWERHLKSSGTLAIDVAGQSPVLKHSRYAVLTVKDAIVDRFRELFNERPSVETAKPDIRIHLFLRGDRARLSLDLSGGGLHRRGYRQSGVTAPMKENLAAGLLLLAGWPGIAAKRGALLDPMCGSGTLLIEAAMMAADIAPALGRDYFGFLGWKRHQAAIWNNLFDEAERRKAKGIELMPPILGYDSSSSAIQAARENIQAAGLNGLIQLQVTKLESAKIQERNDTGLMITNPPYGERLGNTNELRHLYKLLGEKIREDMARWKVAIFSGNPTLDAIIGLKPSKQYALDNGGIPCRLLIFPAMVAEKIPHQAQTLSRSAESFSNRISKNLKHLGRWAKKNGISCYRLYDRDIPEYALAVDLYHSDGQRLVHVQEYQAPKIIDTLKARERLDDALQLLPQLLGIPYDAIYFKLRQPQKKGKQYTRRDNIARFTEVDETGARLLINLTDYLDTGLFLDHRPLRMMLRSRARGKRFLNLFCYTASATIQAALGGASRSVSVDMSPRYMDWAERNLKRNQLSLKKHVLVQRDVMDWLRQERREEERFDLILCDPPTISRSKRMKGSFDVQRDHVALIRSCMALLAPDGELFFSNNFRRFSLDKTVSDEFSVEDITPQTIDEDFKRHPNIHHCWRITFPGDA